VNASVDKSQWTTGVTLNENLSLNLIIFEFLINKYLFIILFIKFKFYVARAVAACSIDADVSGLDGVAISQSAFIVGDAWGIDFVQSRRDTGGSCNYSLKNM
jgi:hypothetical protein